MKMDNLWVKWVHEFFLKREGIHDARIGSTTSRILKYIMSTRNGIQRYQPLWDQIQTRGKFSMTQFYEKAMKNDEEVNWKHLI